MTFSLLPAIQEAVTRRAASADRGAARRPRVTIDVDPAHVADVDAGVVQRVLHTLIEAAFDAAACPPLPSDAPTVHEVVITSVQRADRLEIEIADSGPASPHALDITLATVRAQLTRIGAGLRVDACPEGGRAVTLVLPHRAARRMAA